MVYKDRINGTKNEIIKGGLSSKVDLEEELAVIKNVSKKPINLTGYVLISIVNRPGIDGE